MLKVTARVMRYIICSDVGNLKNNVTIRVTKIVTASVTLYYLACCNGNNGNGWCDGHFYFQL